MKHFDLVELVLSAHNASAGYDSEKKISTFISNKSFGAGDIIETLRAKNVMCFKINHHTVMIFDTEL